MQTRFKLPIFAILFLSIFFNATATVAMKRAHDKECDISAIQDIGTIKALLMAVRSDCQKYKEKLQDSEQKKEHLEARCHELEEKLKQDLEREKKELENHCKKLEESLHAALHQNRHMAHDRPVETTPTQTVTTAVNPSRPLPPAQNSSTSTSYGSHGSQLVLSTQNLNLPGVYPRGTSASPSPLDYRSVSPQNPYAAPPSPSLPSYPQAPQSELPQDPFSLCSESFEKYIISTNLNLNSQEKEALLKAAQAHSLNKLILEKQVRSSLAGVAQPTHNLRSFVYYPSYSAIDANMHGRCPIPGCSVFMDLRKLGKHILNHNHLCTCEEEMCPEGFNLMRDLKTHKYQHKAQPDLGIPCPQCTFYGNEKDNKYVNHLALHKILEEVIIKLHMKLCHLQRETHAESHRASLTSTTPIISNLSPPQNPALAVTSLSSTATTAGNPSPAPQAGELSSTTATTQNPSSKLNPQGGNPNDYDYFFLNDDDTELYDLFTGPYKLECGSFSKETDALSRETQDLEDLLCEVKDLLIELNGLESSM